LGGGAETREEVEKRVVAAVVFTLEGEEDGSTPAHELFGRVTPGHLRNVRTFLK
jgi:hypothetical protein